MTATKTAPRVRCRGCGERCEPHLDRFCWLCCHAVLANGLTQYALYHRGYAAAAKPRAAAPGIRVCRDPRRDWR